MERKIKFGEYELDTKKLPEPNSTYMKPGSNTEEVAYMLLVLKNASVADLTRLTGFNEEEIIESVKPLRKNFGLKGNKKTGYSVSDDIEVRVDMNRWVTDQRDKRITREWIVKG